MRRRINALLIAFMIGLALSGLTAFPLEADVRLIPVEYPGELNLAPEERTFLTRLEREPIVQIEADFHALVSLAVLICGPQLQSKIG